MNKTELVDAMAKQSGLSKKDSEKSLNAFLETVKRVLSEKDKLALVGFGTFKVMHRKKTTGVNPRTKEKISIAAKNVAKLKFSDSVNESLNPKKK